MDTRIVTRRPVLFALALALLTAVAGSATAADESHAVPRWIPGDGAGHLDRAARVARAHLSGGRPLAGARAGDGAGRLDLAAEVARAGRAAQVHAARSDQMLLATRHRPAPAR